MCIRDRTKTDRDNREASHHQQQAAPRAPALGPARQDHLRQAISCLLYTSDAADERSSVDLGGRRIIKQKKKTRKKKIKKQQQ